MGQHDLWRLVGLLLGLLPFKWLAMDCRMQGCGKVGLGGESSAMPLDLAQETIESLGFFGSWCLDEGFNVAWVYRDAFLTYNVTLKGVLRDLECTFGGV